MAASYSPWWRTSNQIDKFNFDYKEITQAISGKKTDPEESKEREEEEKEITFTTKKRGREAQNKKLERKALLRKIEINLKKVFFNYIYDLLFHKAKASAEINPPKTKKPKIEKQKNSAGKKKVLREHGVRSKRS